MCAHTWIPKPIRCMQGDSYRLQNKMSILIAGYVEKIATTHI